MLEQLPLRWSLAAACLPVDSVLLQQQLGVLLLQSVQVVLQDCSVGSLQSAAARWSERSW